MLLSIKASIGAHALIQGLQISKQSIELNAISKPTGALTLVWQRKLITTYLETTLQMQCNITYGRCPNNTLKRNLLTQNGHARWGASNYLTLPIPNVYIYKNNIYIYILLHVSILTRLDQKLIYKIFWFKNQSIQLDESKVLTCRILLGIHCTLNYMI